MKIVILRGGAAPRRRGAAGHTGTARANAVVALGNGSGNWVLVNMSPGVAHQLDTDLRLDSHPGLPEPAVRAVVLTDSQVDHVGGLLSLRDGAPIDLYATPAVFEQLTTALPVLPVLQHYCGVHWQVVPVGGDRRVATFQVEGMPSLVFTAVATDSPLPPHLAHLACGAQPQVGDSIALAVQDLATGQRVFCAPGLSRIGAAELEWMRGADCLLLDHLLPERLPAGTGGDGSGGDGSGGAGSGGAGMAEDHAAADTTLGSTAEHQPWLDLLCGLPARHKVLFADTLAPGLRARWAAQGIALAYDGMEIAL